jgi:flagellar biosynthesis GTPase FlhF
MEGWITGENKNTKQKMKGYFHKNNLIFELPLSEFNNYTVAANIGASHGVNIYETTNSINNAKAGAHAAYMTERGRTASSSSSSSSSAAAAAEGDTNNNSLGVPLPNDDRKNFLDLLVTAVNELEKANADKAAEEANEAKKQEAVTAAAAKAALAAAKAARTVQSNTRKFKSARLEALAQERAEVEAKAAEEAAEEAEEAAKAAEAKAAEARVKAQEKVARARAAASGALRYQSTITLKQLRDKIAEIEPELLNIPEWAIDLPQAVQDLILVATIYNYVDQVHDIKGVLAFKESRVRGGALLALHTCLPGKSESNIETVLFNLFNEALGKKLKPNKVFHNVKSNTSLPNKLKQLLQKSLNDEKLLVGHDAWGLAGTTFDFPACRTLTGRYDPAPAPAADLLRGSTTQSMTFGDVGNRFRISYRFNGSSTSRVIIIDENEIQFIK